jgi:plastocyanin
MTRYLRIAVSAMFTAIVIAACSSNDTPTTSPTTAPADTGGAAATTPSDTGAATTTDGGGQAATAAITIQNFKFGAPLTVKPGTTVTVTNQDTAQHNAVADDGSSFKTPLLAKGQSATFTAPSKPGTYKYSCTVHASMTSIGTLVVSSSG